MNDIEKFLRGRAENEKFWSRFPEQPDFRGLDVLDVGSGWGTLCVDVARSGARSVVGLDLNTDLISFAREYTQEHYPLLPVEFYPDDLSTFQPTRTYDVIVSKDTFEHIMDVPGVLDAMRHRLKPDGRVYIGYSPLYHAPYGDHDRRKVIFGELGLTGTLLAAVPWGHLFVDRLLIWMYNRSHSTEITSLRDLNLNMVKFDEFSEFFRGSGMRIVAVNVNVSTNPVVNLMSVLRRISFLRNVCTQNLYCILEHVREV